jgi:hypothetical protein
MKCQSFRIIVPLLSEFMIVFVFFCCQVACKLLEICIIDASFLWSILVFLCNFESKRNAIWPLLFISYVEATHRL